jgi:hypothetical protein
MTRAPLMALLVAAGLPASGIEADIDLSDGFGPPVIWYRLRGATLIALSTHAEDGAGAGLYRGRVYANDPLRAALAGLRASKAGPPPAPDTPVALVVVRDKEGERRLLAARPVTDPALSKVLAELDRRSEAMRGAPMLALKLEVRPPAAGTVAVRVSAEGAAGARAKIDPSTLQVQAAQEPARAAPGVTALPPEWQVASGPPASVAPLVLESGAHADVALPLALPAGAVKIWIRAVLAGDVDLRVPDGHQQVRMDLSSKAIPVTAKRKGSELDLGP